MANLFDNALQHFFVDPNMDSFLLRPPEEIQLERNRLLKRAQECARSISEDQARAALPQDIDVIVKGGGFNGCYWLGVHSVLARRTNLNMHRFAGVSSGAQTNMELLLAGEEQAIANYLSFGLLSDRSAPNAWNCRAGCRAEASWRKMRDHLFKVYADRLQNLDGRIFVSVSHPLSCGKRNIVYTPSSRLPELAKEIYIATGAALTRCGGKWAVDGAVTASWDQLFFKDGRRPSLLVRPLLTWQPAGLSDMTYKISFEQAVKIIEYGQDDAVRFLNAGAASREHKPGAQALTLVFGGTSP